MNYQNYSRVLFSIKLFAVVTLMSFASGCAEQKVSTASSAQVDTTALNNIVGDWMGELQVPNTKLRLWLTVERGTDGQLKANLDSIDQAPGKKMAVADFSIQDNELSFSIPRISAKYKGQWNEQTQQWQGRFKQGRAFALNFTRGTPKASPLYPELVGQWRGEILGHPLIVRITSNQMGTKAVLDSPDEGVSGLPIPVLAFSNGQISIEIPAAKVTFNGTLAESATEFSGEWVQQGQPRRHIVFSKLEDSTISTAPKRPQHPIGQQPYISKSVTFNNPQAPGVELAGTLTLPEGDGPFPAAILISGSGPQDRDETFMGHKPFAVIADHLTRKGVAVLRYDDRGVAGSSGDYHGATSLDFASDANSAFDYLAKLDIINASAIGMIGHSEGGLIAPLASDNNHNLAFMILLAGPGVNTLELMLAQQKAMAKTQNISEQKLQDRLDISRQIMEQVRTSQTEEAAILAVSNILSAENLALVGAQQEQKAELIRSYTNPWYRYFLTYDPELYFKNKEMPLLVLNGELDVQVPAKENLEGLGRILQDHKDATIKLLPRLNHMFQKAQTGSMTEYRQIEQTFSPDALSLLDSWINQRFQ